MKTIEILKFMGEQGIRYKQDELQTIFNYVNSMIRDNRVIEIESQGKIEAILFISVSDNYEPFFKKTTWTYKPHDPRGKIIYVEKLVAKEWNKEMRMQFEELLTNLYPHFELGVWHRWAKWGDRKTIAFRRRAFHNV